MYLFSKMNLKIFFCICLYSSSALTTTEGILISFDDDKAKPTPQTGHKRVAVSSAKDLLKDPEYDALSKLVPSKKFMASKLKNARIYGGQPAVDSLLKTKTTSFANLLNREGNLILRFCDLEDRYHTYETAHMLSVVYDVLGVNHFSKLYAHIANDRKAPGNDASS